MVIFILVALYIPHIIVTACIRHWIVLVIVFYSESEPTALRNHELHRPMQ